MEIITLKCLIHETLGIKSILKLSYKENTFFIFLVTCG